MPELLIIDRAGAEHTLSVTPGQTLMEAIRNGGIYDIKALCGGSCSCATCHVYLDAGTPLPAMSEDENDLLDGTGERHENSRLACQIHLTGDMGKLRVTIAPED